MWPHVGVLPLPSGLLVLRTAGIILSSIALHTCLNGIKAGKAHLLQWGLPIAAVLGTLFMVLQTVVWLDLWGQGLQFTSGPYGSVFYATRTFHAAHVVVGLGALLWLSVQSWRGVYTPARYLSIRLWAMYWHFVGGVWSFIFVTVYVL